MALEADFTATKDYRVNYCVLDANESPTLPAT
jgi:hypothetical protein